MGYSSVLRVSPGISLTACFSDYFAGSILRGTVRLCVQEAFCSVGPYQTVSTG